MFLRIIFFKLDHIIIIIKGYICTSPLDAFIFCQLMLISLCLYLKNRHNINQFCTFTNMLTKGWFLKDKKSIQIGKKSSHTRPTFQHWYRYNFKRNGTSTTVQKKIPTSHIMGLPRFLVVIVYIHIYNIIKMGGKTFLSQRKCYSVSR